MIEEFIFFHDFTILILSFILRFVGYLIGGLLVNRYVDKGLLEGQLLERV